MNHKKYTQIIVLTTVVLFTVNIFNSGAVSQNQENLMPTLPPDSKGGHFLYSPIYGTTTYLINETGAIDHTWQSAYTPNLDSYMADNGSVTLAISTGRGGFQKIANDGTILWEYHYTRDGSYASHDIIPLPNGDVIMIMQEVKSRAQAIQAGRDPNTVGSTFLPDFIIEVHQTGLTSGDIVWEWHIWDHLIQDYNPIKDNYGNISQHPELININFGENFVGDWIHMNSVDYNPKFDQVLMSAHNFDEVWVIDHGTTTEEAKGHDGGTYGHGGDLLYRWGNPQAYDRGDASTERLYFQHQCCWVKPGLPGEGNILVFCNGNNRPGGPLSTVDEFTPDVDDNTGEYNLPPNGT
ncbi:MAG TPA: aryl-sulfate sulfotransferase, partial [Candidatus Thermoplasmatota archaeon]|nr:aryl-sulfate sulfotransferase [Candidatus Thermoplasmatota archaeon]